MTATKVGEHQQLSGVDERRQVEVKEIPLTQGQFAIVYARDYGWLAAMGSWFAHWAQGTRSFYAVRNIPTGKYRQKQIPMQNAVWEHHNSPVPDGFVVDHINHDTLDNRLSNLRLATQKQNMYNQRTPKNNTSGYKGVVWHSQAQKWRPMIRVD